MESGFAENRPPGVLRQGQRRENDVNLRPLNTQTGSSMRLAWPFPTVNYCKPGSGLRVSAL
jgi:hypothetical protein